MRMRELGAAGPAVSARGLGCMTMITIYGASLDDFAPHRLHPDGRALRASHDGFA